MTAKPNPAKPARSAARKRPPAKPPVKPALTSRVIDLDASRAARAESAGEPVTLKLGGVMFELPPELPVEFALHAAEGHMREAIDALLGDSSEAFFALRPSMPDVEALVGLTSEVYGVTPGE